MVLRACRGASCVRARCMLRCAALRVRAACVRVALRVRCAALRVRVTVTNRKKSRTNLEKSKRYNPNRI